MTITVFPILEEAPAIPLAYALNARLTELHEANQFSASLTLTSGLRFPRMAFS
jgi:hypothetical protein